MNFNKHSDLENQHAFLGGSKYHWVNYDEEKIDSAYLKFMAIQKGIELHDLAKRLIELGVKLPKIKKAFNLYVNDAIGYRMAPELTLFYSYNAFGTCDSICFRDGLLRIHDLKTGVTAVSMRQLEIYSALFCLEYSVNPIDINIELRIYQTDNDVVVNYPIPDDINFIMNKIVLFDKKIDKIKKEEERYGT
jgi:hypothetical protein